MAGVRNNALRTLSFLSDKHLVELEGLDRRKNAAGRNIVRPMLLLMLACEAMITASTTGLKALMPSHQMR